MDRVGEKLERDPSNDDGGERMPAASGEPGGRYTGRAGMCLEELEEKTMETRQKPQVLASWRVIVAKELR